MLRFFFVSAATNRAFSWYGAGEDTQPNKSQWQPAWETCREWKAAPSSDLATPPGRSPVGESRGHQRGTIQIRLKKEFQAELDASRTAAAENRVPQPNIGRCGDWKES